MHMVFLGPAKIDKLGATLLHSNPITLAPGDLKKLLTYGTVKHFLIRG